VIPGTYTVSEDANPFYARTFSGDCSASGTVTLGLGEDKTCTITNTVLTSSPATLHVIKQVVNTHGGIKTPSNFWVRVKASGTDVPGSPAHGMAAPGTIYALAAGTYVVSENADASYVRSFSGDCDANGVVTLSAAADKTCTITNTDIAAASIYSSVSSSVPPTGGGGFQTQRPVIHVTKKPNRFRLPFGGGAVTYTYTVSNPGTVPLDSVQVSDDKCGPVTYRFGDLNGNGLLNADESWNYSCRSDIQSTTVNTVTATGKANNETALDTATARVIVAPVIAPAAPSVTAPPSSVMPPVPVLPITGVDFGSRSVQLVLLGLLMGVALLSLSVSRRLKTVINS
jgi:hypothetical protein